MIAVLQIERPLVEVSDASEWRGRLTFDESAGESARLRFEIGLASANWSGAEGAKTPLLREIVHTTPADMRAAHGTRPDPAIGSLIVLVSRNAALVSFVIAGLSAGFSVALVQSRNFTPLISTAAISLAFFCAGMAQRVIGRKILEVLRQHEESFF